MQQKFPDFYGKDAKFLVKTFHNIGGSRGVLVVASRPSSDLEGLQGLLGEEWVAIMKQELLAFQDAMIRIAQVSRLLKHPLFVWFLINPCDPNAAGRQFDGEEYNEASPAFGRSSLDCKELTGGDAIEMRLNKPSPLRYCY